MSKKVIGICVACILILISTIFLLIDAIKALQTINETIAQYSSSDYQAIELLTQTKKIAIAQLVFSVFIILFSAIAIITCFASDYSKTPFNMMSTTLFVAVVQKLVALFLTDALAKQIAAASNFYYSTETTVIVCIVFLFIAALLILIGMICESKENEKAASGVGLTVLLLLLIIMIIVMASSSDSEALSTIYYIIFIISLLAAAIAYCLVFVEKTDVPSSMTVEERQKTAYRTSNYSIHPSTTKEQAVAAPATELEKKNDSEKNIDPAERLTRLKKLLDDGIITQEEYEEKRKKYLNEL